MTEDIRGHCWHCARGLTAADYGREATCPGCGKSTRACRNCRHYAPGRPNECLEPMVERVLEKERANFCELFDPADRPLSAGAGKPEDALRKAAEDIFRR